MKLFGIKGKDWRKLKELKVRSYIDSFVVGKDINLGQVENLSLMVLIGRHEYARLNTIEMID